MLHKDDDLQSTKEPILLNGESLARHFTPTMPGLKKLIGFMISDAYNTHKNKKGAKKRASSEQTNLVLREDNSIETYSDSDSNSENEIEEKMIGEEEKLAPLTSYQNPWDIITPGAILGVIPELHMIPEIQEKVNEDKKNRQLTNNKPLPLYIFMVTDEFELGIGTKAQPKDYDKENQKIYHYQIPMTDFGGGGITSESVLAAVYHMRQIIEEGGCVYIHCKAGRARSAMIVATYLAIYPPEDSPVKQYDLKSAVDYLKSIRSQVDLHSERVKGDEWQKIQELDPEKVGKLQKASAAIALHQAFIDKQQELLAENIKKNKESFKTNDVDLREYDKITSQILRNIPIFAFNEKSKSTDNQTLFHGNSPLSTLEFKNHLIQLTSFKQLKIFAAHAKGRRAAYTMALCNQILQATDDKWFDDRYIDKKNPIIKLFYNSKTSKEHRNIINEFIKDVYSYRQSQLKNDTSSFKNNENVRELNNYVHYLHGISLTAKCRKRSLEMCWENVCHQLETLEGNPLPKNKKSAIESLDLLKLKLKRRIAEDEKFFKGFHPNLDIIDKLKNEINEIKVWQPNNIVTENVSTFLYRKINTTVSLPKEEKKNDQDNKGHRP